MLHTALAVPTALFGALYWKGQSLLANPSTTNDHLVYVHVYHRHGEKTPGTQLYTNTMKESKIWIPLLSKQYYCSKEMENAINDSSHKLNHWSNINNRLNGTYLKSINICDDIKDGVTRDVYKKCVYLGQLSENGAIQLHHFGKWLRQRYVDKFCFLPSTYKTSYNESCKLYVESTNYKRTIFSVDSLLNGLYGNNQRYKGDARIPIHIDKDTNHKLLVSGKCKKYYKEMYWPFNPLNTDSIIKPENMESDILKIQTKLRDIYKCNIGVIIAALKPRLVQNVDLPSNIDKNDCRKYIDYISGFLIEFFKRNDMLRISNGVLFGELLNSMKYEHGKFVISSGHDFTIFPIICSLLRQCDDENIIKQHEKWPKYGDNVIFEVWELTNKCNTRFIRILHNKEVLPINGKEFIELYELENILKDLIISSKTLWNTECCC